MRTITPLAVAAAAALLAGAPALAGNTLVPPGVAVAVARSGLTVTPAREWNKMGARPGRASETWTIDGDTLDDLTFYGGIETDRTLFREVSKRNRPLPHFHGTMLATDIPALFESSYRIALDTPLMTVDAIEPATFAGHKGVRFRYAFSKQGEEVRRQGEGYAAIVDKRLYMATFEAPVIHFYDAVVGDARAVVASARIVAVP